MCAAAALLSLALSEAFDGPLDRNKVGTLGEWAAAVGTVLAVYVALQSSRLASEAAETQRSEDAKNRQAELQHSLAGGVVLEFYPGKWAKHRPQLPPGQPEVHRCNVAISVYSSDPIRDVRVLVDIPQARLIDARQGPDGGPIDRGRVDPVPIGFASLSFSHVPPGERSRDLILQFDIKETRGNPMPEPMCTLEWVGCFGTKWRSAPEGHPVIVTDDLLTALRLPQRSPETGPPA